MPLHPRQVFTLTPAEWAAIQHRLETPDALADALEDDYARDDVETVASLLLLGEYESAMAVSETLVEAVMVDAIEGSTYAASVLNTPLERKALAALEHAAEKVGKHYQRRVIAPNY